MHLSAPLRICAVFLPLAVVNESGRAAERATSSAAAATTLTAEEARILLRQAQAAGNRPGSYRSQTVRTTDSGTTTTTILTKRKADGRAFSRTETVRQPKDHPEKARTSLTIRNAEGEWQIYEKQALLVPQPFNLAPIVDTLVGAPNPKPAAATPTAAANPLLARAAELAKHITLAGERFEADGQPRVRITRTYDEEAIKFMDEVADTVLADFKKQLPFGKRMLISAAMAVSGGPAAALPAREVFIVDPAVPRILSIERFKRDGKLRNKSTPKEPEKIDELPDTTFELPAGIEVLRPKSIAEAWELGEKLGQEAKQKAAAK